jgi:hypothetical protein
VANLLRLNLLKADFAFSADLAEIRAFDRGDEVGIRLVVGVEAVIRVGVLTFAEVFLLVMCPLTWRANWRSNSRENRAGDRLRVGLLIGGWGLIPRARRTGLGTLHYRTDGGRFNKFFHFVINLLDCSHARFFRPVRHKTTGHHDNFALASVSVQSDNRLEYLWRYVS